MNQTIEAEAIVLRTVNFQEADRVVTLLVETLGKVSALARGARKSRRRFSGLGSFARGTAGLVERGGDLWSLESFEVTKPRTDLGSDLVKAAHGAYVCELVERLSAGNQADSDVFALLDEALDRLAQGAASSERLRSFELGLLARLGLAPALDRCGACRRTDLAVTGGRWRGEAGLLLCPGCSQSGVLVTPAVVSALQTLAEMELSSADSVTLPAAVNQACRRILWPFIEHHVGGPLKTMKFLTSLASSGLARPNHPSTATEPGDLLP